MTKSAEDLAASQLVKKSGGVSQTNVPPPFNPYMGCFGYVAPIVEDSIGGQDVIVAAKPTGQPTDPDSRSEDTKSVFIHQPGVSGVSVTLNNKEREANPESLKVPEGLEIDDIKIPEAYICGINGTLMLNPWVTSDGNTYNKDAIERWYKNHCTYPASNVPGDRRIFPNYSLRSAIEEWLKDLANKQVGKDSNQQPQATGDQLVQEIDGATPLTSVKVDVV